MLISLLVALTFVIVGCNDLLQENPASTVSPVNFYRDEQDALVALNGAYASLTYYHHRNSYYLLSQPSGQMVNRRDGTWDLGCTDVFTCTSSNDQTTNFWRTLYEAINRANAVIDNVSKIEDIDADEQARIVAEARFLRAVHYFNLVRTYGGVPLFEHETTDLADLAKSRTSADEIYEFIIADLVAAKNDLPSEIPDSDFGRASRGAAQTLLGEVYLQRGVAGETNPFGDPLYWPSAQPDDLQNAITEFRDVMDLGYALVPDYSMMWNPDTQNNSEVIFSVIAASIDGYGGDVHAYAGPLFTPWGRGFAALGAELPFWESYEAGDIRRDVTWISEFVDQDGVLRVYNPDDVLGDNYGREFVAPGKHVTQQTDVVHGSYPMDAIVLRYADVLLMLAEALWHQNSSSGEALNLVNQVRDRANLDPLSALTKEALYWERNWELATELQTWFDAPRFWDLHIDHMVANAQLRETQPNKYVGQSVPQTIPRIEDQPKIRLMPIPLNAIDLNPNLEQNPSY